MNYKLQQVKSKSELKESGKKTRNARKKSNKKTKKKKLRKLGRAQFTV